MSKSHGLISVIIPVFNEQKLIGRAVDSVLNQSYPNIEIIIIDDGSNDKTLSVLDKKYADYQNVKIFKNKTNKRQGYCRNLGIKKANGQYLAFLDADDWIEPEFITDLIKLAEKGQYEVVACGVKLINPVDDSESFYHGHDFTSQGGLNLLKKYARHQVATMAWNKIYQIDFLRKNKIFFPEKCYHEDILFTAKVCEAVSRYKSISKVYLNYFNNTHSVTRSKQTYGHLESYFQFIDDFAAFCQTLTKKYGKASKTVCEQLISAHYLGDINLKIVNYCASVPSCKDQVKKIIAKRYPKKQFIVYSIFLSMINNLHGLESDQACQELARIKSSKGWPFLVMVNRLHDFLLPSGSRRVKIIKKIRRLL